jgi:hypothetical protein
MHVEVPPCYEDTRRRRYTYLLGIEYQYIMTNEHTTVRQRHNENDHHLLEQSFLTNKSQDYLLSYILYSIRNYIFLYNITYDLLI